MSKIYDQKQAVKDFTEFLASLDPVEIKPPTDSPWKEEKQGRQEDDPMDEEPVDNLLTITEKDIADYGSIGITLNGELAQNIKRCCRKCGKKLSPTRYYMCNPCSGSLPEDIGDAIYSYISGK